MASLSAGMSLQSGHNVTHIHLHKAPYRRFGAEKGQIYLYAIFYFKFHLHSIDVHKQKFVSRNVFKNKLFVHMNSIKINSQWHSWLNENSCKFGCKAKCNNAHTTISNVTIHTQHYQMLQFTHNSIKCNNSHTTLSNVTIHTQQYQMLQFTHNNIKCNNSHTTLSNVTIHTQQYQM